MNLSQASGAKIFLTGVTGFVGKVVLEEILRRREALGFERIFVLIRTKQGHCPEERFKTEVAASPCLSKIPGDWTRWITVIEGELSQERCGFSPSDWERLTRETTHIINCAASVEFDLPLEVAAASNITSSLNVLGFAKHCSQLQSMVNVSTAYVTPHPKDGRAIKEKLNPLPFDPEEVYAKILQGKADAKALLKLTGLPNTYTLTKCMAEHLLIKKKGSVPLAIIRPSIVSATWKYPFPGWIDSRAAFAGFVSLIGAGYLRAVVAQYSTLLDVVPCDFVAEQVITAAFQKIDPGHTPIRYAVAGAEKSCSIRTCIEIIEGYFRRYRVGKIPNLRYVGDKNLKFLSQHWRYHLGPGKILAVLLKLTGNPKKLKQVRKLTKNLDYLNRGFPYFTHNTFDFRASHPIEDPDFTKEKYIEGVCRGVYRYLMKKDDTQVSLAGRKHWEKSGDLLWVRKQANGNAAIRVSAYLARKALRRCTDLITFDRAAFEAARREIPPQNLLVVVPTHRSYMDFVLCSYLFFAHPELGIAIPHIAAAEEFSKVKILGKLFKKTQAFYIKRGLGRENPELTKQLHELVKNRETLEFFIEGTRSRSRKLLQPRRGILKCLQASGQACTILPITLSYDRLPEEAAFLKELKGEPKPRMRLNALLRWTYRVWRGRINLGRIHMSCGRPLNLESTHELRGFSRQVMAELQSGLRATTYHLKVFLKQRAAKGLDPDWLKSALEARGLHVLPSSLPVEGELDATLERSLRYQWMHVFYPEVKIFLKDHPVIQNHLMHNDYLAVEGGRGAERESLAAEALKDPRMHALLKLLFEPMVQDYLKLAEALEASGRIPAFRSPREFLTVHPESHLPTLEEAFEDLVHREILSPADSQACHAWGAKAVDLEEWKLKLEWPDLSQGLAKVG